MVDFNSSPQSDGDPERLVPPRFQLERRLKTIYTLLMRNVSGDMASGDYKNEINDRGIKETVADRLNDYYQRVCERFDAYGKLDGFECEMITRTSIGLMTEAGYKKASFTYSFDGQGMSSSGLYHDMTAELRANTALRNGTITQSKFERMLAAAALERDAGLPAGEKAPYWDSTIELDEILDPESAADFLGRVVSRLGTVQRWYESCQKQGINPLSDEGWAHGV